MRKKYGYAILFLIIVFLLSSESLYSKEWWKLYFTSPGKKIEKTLNPETVLIDLLGSAKKSFYGAFYDISSRKIVNALRGAYKRGVDVKLVTESDNLEKKEMKVLLGIGIPIVPDARSGLMHNKFAVIDEEILWTGSYNLTQNGANRNNNNAIKISSPDLASIYLDEFKEMFEHNIFGNRKDYGVFPHFRKRYYVKIGDTNINAYFSPEDNIERIILKRLKKAKNSIHFMAFSFTSDKIGEEMIRISKNGVKVYGIIEKIGSGSRYSEFLKMKLEGIQVKLDKNRYKMHHKVIIIDKERVITGSFNFSKNANERNDENILIIDSRVIAKDYLTEFYRLYN